MKRTRGWIGISALWIGGMCSHLAADSSGKYNLFDLSTGMTYDQVKAKATGDGMLVLKDQADQVVLQAKNTKLPNRPFIITVFLTPDDRAREIKIQEANGTDDAEVLSAAKAKWGEPRVLTASMMSPSFLWGDPKAVHAESDNELYNSYRGCVCIRLIDPNAKQAEAAPNAGHGDPVRDFSITGIALGAPYEQALTKLTSDGFAIQQIHFPWSNEAAGLAQKGKLAFVEEYLIQSVNGKVIHIRHGVRFASGGQPDLEATLTGLRTKYGRTTNERLPMDQGTNGFYRFEWNYDDQARSKSQAGSVCNAQGLQPNQPLANNGAGKMELVRQTDPNCARGALAEIRYDPRTSLVTALLVDVADYRTLNQFMGEKIAVLRAAQRAQAPKSVKPPL